MMGLFEISIRMETEPQKRTLSDIFIDFYDAYGYFLKQIWKDEGFVILTQIDF